MGKGNKLTTSGQTQSRAEYLSKYLSSGANGDHAKKKKKKKKRLAGSQINVVDEDVGWDAKPRSPSPPRNNENNDDSDDGPVVENVGEIQHQLKLLRGQAKFSSQWEVEEAPGDSNATKRHDSDSDSPPRRPHHQQVARTQQRHDSNDESPPRRGLRAAATHARHDSDDESPPRRGAPPQGVTAARVANERMRHDSDDESPPRRAAASGSAHRAEPSHQRRARHDSDDESPPRRTAAARSAPHAEPSQRIRARYDSDDENPPRRTAAAKSAPHAEPAQRIRARHDSDDESPPRRTAAAGSAHRAEAPKHSKARHDSDNESPPRRGTHQPDSKQQLNADESSGRKTNRSGQGSSIRERGGLIESKEMTAQLQEKREAERRRVKEMDPSVSGRGAASTFRVDGKIVSKEEYEEKMAAKAPKRQRKFLEEDVEWKGGLAQRRAAEQQQAAMQREGQKKFQREFDEDADAGMKEEMRQDDPMAAYFMSKRQGALQAAAEAAPSAVHASELSAASGFKVPQHVPEHSWIRRGVQALPNRYNIKPGRHWDGVHRSNGFEHKFIFQYQHRRADRERHLYVTAEDL